MTNASKPEVRSLQFFIKSINPFDGSVCYLANLNYYDCVSEIQSLDWTYSIRRAQKFTEARARAIIVALPQRLNASLEVAA